MENYFNLKFEASSTNERFARSVVSAFVLPLDPSVEELSSIKTAVSEAVTNAVVHAYEGKGGEIEMNGTIFGKTLTVTIDDCGKGIEDIAKARQAFFTTGKEGERSGMGFTVMEAFMDKVEVSNLKPHGIRVVLTKKLGGRSKE